MYFVYMYMYIGVNSVHFLEHWVGGVGVQTYVCPSTLVVKP